MNNRSRQIRRAMRMMYGNKEFKTKRLTELQTALNNFAEGFAAALSDFADAIKNIHIPTLQNIAFTWARDEPIEEEIRLNDLVSCDSCYHYLGGGYCRINLESECREGGGYEAWVPRIAPVPALEASLESKEAPESEEEPEADNKPDLPKPS